MQLAMLGHFLDLLVFANLIHAESIELLLCFNIAALLVLGGCSALEDILEVVSQRVVLE